MKTFKTAAFAVVLLLLSYAIFARELDSNGNYTVRMEGATCYIDDNGRGMCIGSVTIQRKSSGTYEFICGSGARVVVSSAVGAANLISNYLGSYGVPVRIASWVASTIYYGACWYFGD